MQHTVKKGESLWLIAKQNKLSDWKTIYDHPNNKTLRKQRPNPNLIFPGDKVYVPPKKPNKASQPGGTSQAHTFKAPTCGGVHGLKWEPAQGTFGKVKSVRLTGETDLPEGTELTFGCMDVGDHKLELPDLKVKVQGKKIAADWDLSEINGVPEHYMLDVVTFLKDPPSSNPATLKLEDRRCAAKEIKLRPATLQKQADAKQKKDPKGKSDADADLGRKPNSKGLLQVVADANMKFSLETPLNVLGKGAKAEREATDKRAAMVRHVRKGHGGLKNVSDFVKSYQKQLWGKQAPTKAGKFAAAYSAGGAFDVNPRLDLSGSCDKKHSFSLSGGKSKDLQAVGEEVSLPWVGSPGLPSSQVQPTTYVLCGKGCEGKERKVTIEVYPSDQILFSVGFDSTMFTALANRINSCLKLTGFGGFALNYTLSAAGFFGWREDSDPTPGESDPWRVFYARELSVSGGVKLGLSLRLSFITMFTGIPPSALKYFADIGLTVGIELSLSLKGLWEHRYFPPSAAPGQKDAGWKGSSGFEAVGGAHLGVYARIGPGELLSVEAVGKATSSIKFSCQPALVDSKFLLKSPKVEMTPVEFIITVTTSLFLVKSEREWKFTWYKPDPNDPLYPPKPAPGQQAPPQHKQWELFDFSQKYDSKATTSGSNIA